MLGTKILKAVVSDSFMGEANPQPMVQDFEFVMGHIIVEEWENYIGKVAKLVRIGLISRLEKSAIKNSPRPHI